jgi:hypothetical protein
MPSTVHGTRFCRDALDVSGAVKLHQVGIRGAQKLHSQRVQEERDRKRTIEKEKPGEAGPGRRFFSIGLLNHPINSPIDLT